MSPAEIATLMAALSHPIRIEIITALQMGESSVTDLSLFIEVPQVTISKHLQILTQARLLERRTAGKYHHYKLIQPEIGAFIATLADEPAGEPQDPNWYKDL